MFFFKVIGIFFFRCLCSFNLFMSFWIILFRSSSIFVSISSLYLFSGFRVIVSYCTRFDSLLDDFDDERLTLEAYEGSFWCGKSKLFYSFIYFFFISSEQVFILSKTSILLLFSISLYLSSNAISIPKVLSKFALLLTDDFLLLNFVLFLFGCFVV